MLIGNMQDLMYEKEVTNYMKLHPGCDHKEAIEHIASHKIPMTMPGTPGWYRDKL